MSKVIEGVALVAPLGVILFGHRTPIYYLLHLAEAACYIVTAHTCLWSQHDLFRITSLNQFTEVEIGNALRNAGCLLHVVSDYYDCVVLAQFVDQLFDAGRGIRIERRTRFVHKKDIGLR